MIGAFLLVIAGVVSQIEMRGGLAPPAGEVVRVDAAGVWLSPAGSGSEPSLAVGWDRVRSVGGPMAPHAARFEAVADLAWRARTRLERGDAIAAEPLFEELFVGRRGEFEGYRGQVGPTAATVAEGLLRCRLRRGAHVAAIDPWLALLRAGPNPEGIGADRSLGPVIDPALGLAPALPPIWLAWPSVQGFAAAAAPASDESPESARTALLRELYVQSARFEAGLSTRMPDVVTDDPGVTLVAQIVASRAGGPEERARARQLLADRVTAGTEPWVEAWCRAAIGRSLLLEADLRSKQRGVVELLHLPARFGRIHPYLAGTALAQASVALRETGDTAGADRLLLELFERYPDHPVFDWEPIRRQRPPVGSAPSPPPRAAAAP